MSGLLNRSLDAISRQERTNDRGSPYARPSGPRRGPSSSEGPWKHDMFRDGASSPSVAMEKPSAKLLIDGLHYEIAESELKDLFEQMGPTWKCFIMYDRSGRSTGKAVVVYQLERDAVRAKQEYDGANAKGQPIKITYEAMRERRGGGGGPVPTGPKRAGSNDSGRLANRIGGSDLLSRIGGGKQGPPPTNAPKGPAASAPSTRPGPNRSISGGVGSGRGRERSSRGGGGGGGGRGGGRKATDARGSGDLDAELEAFMKAPPSKELAQSIHAPQTDASGDVQME